MAEFSLTVMGSAAIASLVVAGVMVHERLQLLAGRSSGVRKQAGDRRRGRTKT